MRETARLTREVYPAGDTEATARDIAVIGDRVRLVESGPANGYPIVLLHGWGATAYNYRCILGPLGRSGFHAIAPDLPGHGWNGSTSHARGAFSVTAMTDWVRALLDELGIPGCVLVGQSLGGGVALDVAARFPDRVSGLVLLASLGFTPIRRVVMARSPVWLHPTTTPRWIVRTIVRSIYGTRGRRWTEDDIDQYWIPLRQKVVVRALIQIAREYDFMPRDPSTIRLDQGRFIIRFGELDGLIPWRRATEHARRFANADVGVMPGVGHVPAEEVPDEVTEIILKVASSAGA